MTTKQRLQAAVLTLITGSAIAGIAAAATDRGWTVPHTRSVSLQDVQFSENPVIPSRQVMLRTKEEDFDSWGPITMYPVVHSPGGSIYYGFVRHYSAGSIHDRFISYTFPEDFCANSGITKSEQDADWDESLADSSTSLPQGHYEVKWVVNRKLVDTGDEFTYPGLKSSN